MNFTQSFEEFSKGLSSTDLMLYAGIGLVIWVLVKDKLNPVQNLFQGLLDTIKKMLNSTKQTPVPVVTSTTNNSPSVVIAQTISENSSSEPQDLFFKLILSWKETRDLANKCGCDKAVEVIDGMFPYLSPNVCGKETKDE